MTRKNRKVETRMLSEYLLKAYPKFISITDGPLGRVDEALMAKVGYKQALGITRPYRPAIDAIVILPRYLLLIEAKVWNVVSGLGKLHLYESLIPSTPELQQYVVKPPLSPGHVNSGLREGVNDLTQRETIMELVVGWTNTNLEIMARHDNVRVCVYWQQWLQDEVDRMHKYWTKEYQLERQQRLEMRERLGLE